MLLPPLIHTPKKKKKNCHQIFINTPLCDQYSNSHKIKSTFHRSLIEKHQKVEELETISDSMIIKKKPDSKFENLRAA